MTNDDTEWMALARYAAGECSPEERETMRHWIAENEERARSLGYAPLAYIRSYSYACLLYTSDAADE